jgi:predicted nucleic acid-binding Zn ribbon protein
LTANDSCSPLCAGSLPPDSSVKRTPCADIIVYGAFRKQRFDLKVLSNQRSEHAHLFTDFDSMDSFPGFSHEEKARLTSWGVKTVDLCYIDKSNKRKCFGRESCPVNDLPSRVEHHDDNNTNTNVWLVVILIIFLLIILWIVWRTYTSS